MITKKWRGRPAVIYARVAHTSDNTAAYMQAQVNGSLAFAAREGVVVFGNYNDLGSGSEPSQQRSGYSDMLKAVERGDHDIVLVSDLDRISRNVACLEAEVAVLEQAGATMVTSDGSTWAKAKKSPGSLRRALLRTARSGRSAGGKKRS